MAYYHRKVGNRLSVKMSVKRGYVTLLSIVETVGSESIFTSFRSGIGACPILEIGNSNSKYKFSIGTRDFVEKWNSHGPAHYCTIEIGHVVPKIKKLGELLSINVDQVC